MIIHLMRPQGISRPGDLSTDITWMRVASDVIGLDVANNKSSLSFVATHVADDDLSVCVIDLFGEAYH